MGYLVLKKLLLKEEFQKKSLNILNGFNSISSKKYNIVIPSFNEKTGLYHTLNQVSKIKSQNLLNIFVVNYDSHNYTTCCDIRKWVEKKGIRNIYVVDEKNINPNFTCIGQARSIGFYLALALEKKQNPKTNFKNTVLISCDADTCEIDKNLIPKIENELLDRDVGLISYRNHILEADFRCNYIRPFKIFEDVFFEIMYRPVGIVNGRAYAVRGSSYLSCGGVNPNLATEDKDFGLRVNKFISKRVYLDSYVVNSARRLYKFAEGLDMNVSYEVSKTNPGQLSQQCLTDLKVNQEQILKNYQQWIFGIPRNYLKSQSYSKTYFTNEQILETVLEYINNVSNRVPTLDNFDLDRDNFNNSLNILRKLKPDKIEFDPSMVKLIYGSR